MRYNFEFKRKCVEMYRQGMLPNTPDGVSKELFRATVRKWVRIEDARGPEALKHKIQNKVWSSEEKHELVSRVLAGNSINSVAINAGVSKGILYQWVRKYE
uniref:transposase n=1 Tax=Mycoplasmopsis opalescens TaxID=114886 RepID=UPI0004A6C1B8